MYGYQVDINHPKTIRPSLSRSQGSMKWQSSCPSTSQRKQLRTCENSQTVVNMARFYTALATDGQAAKPEIVHRRPERTRLFTLTAPQMAGLRSAMAGASRRVSGARKCDFRAVPAE